MSERFFTEQPLAVGPLAIEGAEAHHLAQVCRLRVGDRFTLFNGDGCEYPAEITGTERRRVMVEVAAGVKVNREAKFAVTVAAPLPKGERAQFLIEKLTELGVSTFVPLHTRRSVVKAGENKLDKLERYVIEASKQCGRNLLMSIANPADWADFCCQPDLHGLRYLAHPGEQAAPISTIQSAAAATCAVGPEGGFTEDEIELARSAGWQLVELGPRILRIETAAIAMAAHFTMLPPA